MVASTCEADLERVVAQVVVELVTSNDTVLGFVNNPSSSDTSNECISMTAAKEVSKEVTHMDLHLPSCQFVAHRSNQCKRVGTNIAVNANRSSQPPTSPSRDVECKSIKS